MKRGKRNKHIWEDTDIAFLKENYLTMTNLQLAKGLDINLTTCRTKLYELGLKRMEMEYWTEEQVQFLRDNYREMGDTEMAELFEETCPKQKSWSHKHIEKKRRYLKLKRSAEEKNTIKKRNTALGRFAMCSTNMWKTRGVAPIGDIRIWKYTVCQGGGQFAVIKTENGFVHYNRWLYETTFGKLTSEDIVRTKSNKTIADGPEDLEVIDRAEHARRGSLSRYPEELRETVQLIRDLNRVIINNN